MKRTRQDLLKGIDGARFLRAAAREMDALGRDNARIAEVDARAHLYLPGLTDIFYLERENTDGSWSAETVEDIAGQGSIYVTRELRDNLVPALTYQAIGYLVRGGLFNDFESAKTHILEQCRFLSAGRVQ